MRRAGRRRAARFAVLALAALLSGCGSSVAPAPSPTPTDVPLPTPVTTAYAVQATVWYAGLIVHVDSVTSVLRAGVGAVTAAIRIENPGPDLASLDAALRLTSSGQIVEPIHGTTLPDIPAGGSAAVSVEFDVEAGFDVPAAVLRIGRTSYHQAVVPVAPGSVVPVTLQPRSLQLDGTAQAGNLAVTVRGGELRADLPDWGIELGPDAMALSVTYDARYAGSFSGGFAFTTGNIALVLPDGTKLAARPDGRSAPAILIGPGATVTSLVSRFDVAAPGTGSYALEIRDGTATKRIPLTIAGP